jgi:aminopeptidase N
MKYIKFFVIFSLFVTSCYYKPFIGYRLNKKGFKHFSHKEKFQGDNSNVLRNYDVKTYDWAIDIDPEKEKIAGKMVITFVPTHHQSNFMFDLQKKMKIDSFSCSVKEAELKHKNDFLFLNLKTPIQKNKRIKLTINYHGKPANLAGEGPLRWQKDKQNRPWISTSTEGIGPHFIMPCNALLRDEADTTQIVVTVPKGLIVASNGRLKKVEHSLSKSTFTHLVTNPINIYNISFNVGHFVTINKPYIDLNNIKRNIECIVLDYDKIKADKFYNQAPKVMAVFEDLFGEFPWWNDGCKFIQSNFGAMEHQSGIALGSDYRLDWRAYNLTLVHELAHEWWGNNVTAFDYCDVWMHEGLATYAEALFIEKVYGKDDYRKKINYFNYSTYNQIPIRKKCDVMYTSWINAQDQDIYDKGALLMHSLRMQVNNDSLFFNALKIFQKKMGKKNINAQQFTDEFNKLLNGSYTSLFDLYLNETLPPILVYYFTTNQNDRLFHYKWLDPIPFKLTNGLSIKYNNQISTKIFPSTTFQTLIIDKDHPVLFDFGSSIYFLPNKLNIK